MTRNLTTQDISWFLDLHRKGQLNWDPPYQRRSVWSPRDRRFFVDTILNNYPAPPIFLHKTIDDIGHPTYHVVDGKQRLQTIVDFTNDKVRVPDDFSDLSLQRKVWSELPQQSKVDFWNYPIIVEMLPDVSDSMIKNTFERINRNSRRLTAQELRHAKYDGWFIQFVEQESEKPEWRTLGVWTAARAKRMAHVQFVSELCSVVIRNKIVGFDQNMLDDLYAEYDDISELGDFDEDNFRVQVDEHKVCIGSILKFEPLLTKYLRTQSHFYSLWAYLHLHDATNCGTELASTYLSFLDHVQDVLTKANSLADIEAMKERGVDTPVFDYAMHTRGASTDEAPRVARHQALISTLSG